MCTRLSTAGKTELLLVSLVQPSSHPSEGLGAPEEQIVSVGSDPPPLEEGESNPTDATRGLFLAFGKGTLKFQNGCLPFPWHSNPGQRRWQAHPEGSLQGVQCVLQHFLNTDAEHRPDRQGPGGVRSANNFPTCFLPSPKQRPTPAPTPTGPMLAGGFLFSKEAI